MKKHLLSRQLPCLLMIAFILVIQAENAQSAGSARSEQDHELAEKGAPHTNFKVAEFLPLFDALAQEALEKNPELKFYEVEIEAAKGNRKTAGVWENPEVSGSLGRKQAWNEEGDSTGKGMAGEISLMQSFEWPGRIRLRKAIADCDIELAELGFEQFRALLAVQVKVAAYELFAAREQADATLEVADHFRALLEVLLERNQAGLTSLLETRIIEAMEFNMRREANQAFLHSQEALFHLNQLCGVSSDAGVELNDLTFVFQPLAKERNEMVTLAKANDFSVRLRKMELTRQETQMGLEKNERFPSISIGPGIAHEKAGDRESVIGAAIALPFPLWNRNQGNIKAAEAKQTQAELSLRIAEREVEQEVLKAMIAYETKRKEIAGWKPETIDHFKEAAELADRHYRLGAVPVSTYLELQTQYLETIKGLLATKKEAFEAVLQLELLTGTSLSLINSGTEENK